MSAAKHTPGPWAWGDDYRGLYGSGPQNEVLTYATYEGMWLSHVAQRDANARLIAAAPDLLKALQEILACDYHGFPIAPMCSYYREQAEKAVANAMGP